ncbi:hypothetical protein T05_1546 [Trichinella murrelli]|uniref:Uncharacterized protein n=1 Tax=Trichinella murrelli TaxID=144512 RepID=A0A0V0TR78_9BILA|nr:hypothetical protein T05_1546 [Trichinella murrelli]
MLPGKREPRRKGNRFRRHEECTKSGERHIDILKRLQEAYKIGPHRVSANNNIALNAAKIKSAESTVRFGGCIIIAVGF